LRSPFLPPYILCSIYISGQESSCSCHHDSRDRYEKQGIDRNVLTGAQLRPVHDEKMVGIKAVAAQVKAAQEKK
jgi:hypothetical protein